MHRRGVRTHACRVETHLDARTARITNLSSRDPQERTCQTARDRVRLRADWNGRILKRMNGPTTYGTRIAAEKDIYRDCLEVHSLPEIFHYWSNRYVRPKLEALGFS